MSPSEHLQILAHFQARPDRVDELREVLLGLIPPTRVEAGCLRYELLQSREDPTRFTFVEEWTDEHALEEHFATDHIADAAAKFPDLLVGGLEIVRLNRIG